jgi:predicted TIM-barrel fold metal-dependent hydrolase
VDGALLVKALQRLPGGVIKVASQNTAYEAFNVNIVWGSDWPHVMLDPPVPNTGDLCSLLAVWVPDAATRNKILVDNPARLYGFK